MRTVYIDFNARRADGSVSVRAGRLVGAMKGETVNVIDRDGELAALAVVGAVDSSVVRLDVASDTICDWQPARTFAMHPNVEVARAVRATTTATSRAQTLHAQHSR